MCCFTLKNIFKEETHQLLEVKNSKSEMKV